MKRTDKTVCLKEFIVISKLLFNHKNAYMPINYFINVNLKIDILFQHDREGLPIGDLRHELEDEGLLEHIPRRRMDYLLQHADRDRDKNITYREFVRMVSFLLLFFFSFFSDSSKLHQTFLLAETSFLLA